MHRLEQFGRADYPGGGLYNKGILALANCTVANNFAFFGGGGILNAGTGTVTLYGCTIAGNTAHVGSGANLDNSGTGTMTLDNTIVAEPHGSGGDIGGTVSGDHSLIDGTNSAGGLVDGVNGNLVGVDPGLGGSGTTAG